MDTLPRGCSLSNGKRPPTEKVATACDAVFPERRGWFLEYYMELRGWSEVPAAFKDWAGLEDKAASLLVWKPGIVHGLLQTEDYARALIAVMPMVPPETATAWLAQRMERHRRVLHRDDPPARCSSSMSFAYTGRWEAPRLWPPGCAGCAR